MLCYISVDLAIYNFVWCRVLFRMNIGVDLIWNDDSESEVFAQAQSKDLSLIFRYSLNLKLPQSLSSRVVNCYYNLSPKNASETFSDRAAMREALYSSICRVWDQCAMHPSISASNVTVEIYEDAERQDQWRISHESLYKQYVESLLPISSLFQSEEAKLQAYYTVDYSSLVQIGHLEGRGRTAIVRCSSGSGSLHVFKGVDFGTFLKSRADFEHRKDVCYHEIRTISSLPRHSNIIHLADVFAIVQKIENDRQAFVCGTLYSFMKHGTLDDQVKNIKTIEARLALRNKAIWCFQMASAIAHTHFTAHTFHMNIKPINFVLDSNQNLILIDWKQSGTSLYTLAPEANGSWNVKEAKVESSSSDDADSAVSKLVYERYVDHYRENLAWGRSKWNVYSFWSEFYSRALMTAEVFSLGRTMWMLLQQVTQSEVEDLDEVVVYWSEDARDIPDDWKAVVNRCLDFDSNKRIELMNLLNFWEKVKCKDWTNSMCNPDFSGRSLSLRVAA